MTKYYMCIDLKSFYASVECVERGLNPLDTNLVVADDTRTEKTICLAVSPSLKQYGIKGRARLYEVVQKVKELNKEKLKNNNYKKLKGKSYIDSELKKNKNLEIDYIVAVPQMRKYMKYSTDIYNIYLKYLSPEDILVYSIDEVFCDITNYLKLYKSTPKELTSKIIKSVYYKTGITATAGIGTNMYLAKVAMDIVAKHVKANEQGVRIAVLNEMAYRKLLWEHKPLTDFWRVGKGISKKLEDNGMFTMGDIALTSIENENKLFKLFGINAELLIDHAWGYEPCTISDVKKYKPKNNSISSGQVLHEPYDYEKAKLIVMEMAELLSLDLVNKNIVTDEIVLEISYDSSNLDDIRIFSKYIGEVKEDYYGRLVPKPAHGSIRLDHMTSSTKLIMKSVLELYEKNVNKDLLVRKVNISFNNIIKNDSSINKPIYKQFDLFSNNEEEIKNKEKELSDEEDERKIQKTILDIKSKYGKNAILKGMNLMEGATTIDRNKQVGGHKG